MSRRAVKTPAAPVAEPAPATRARWVMLMPHLPGSGTTKRVRVWRRLQGIGAVALRPSVYVLPARDDCMETLQWVAREIVEMGGQASLCEGQFLDAGTDAEIERRFVEARNADYAELAREARDVARSAARKRVAATAAADIEAAVRKLRRTFDAIAAVDFGDAPGREAPEGLIRGLEATIASRRGRGKAASHRPAAARPRGAVWVTRSGVHVDRIACAWLIRRFIDPDGVLKFVPAKGYVPAPGELRYDMYDAEFTHVGDKCSFEVLLERMGIADPALHAIAEIIHDIDLRDEKFKRGETAGVASQVAGLCVGHREDADRIAAATPMLEALHTFFRRRGDGRKRRTTE